MKYTMEIRHFIDISHQLADTPQLVTKACHNLHGHTMYFKVGLESDVLQENGMVVDFKAIKNVIDILDHRHVNNVFKEFKFNKEATSENIANFVYQRIIDELNLVPTYVSVCEGYKGDERASWVTYRVE
jgi:6-pyruvoyltetrahydropterin/6-carboxytetrahydropterin synthase